MDIRDFIRLPHRFMWGGAGGDDCVMFLASWIAHQTGTDPAGEARGSYYDEAGAHRIVEQAGGMVPLIGSFVEPFGFIPTSEPATGDIGVVLARSDGDEAVKPIGAIKFGPLWAFLTPQGVRAHPLQFIAAWHNPSEGQE